MYNTISSKNIVLNNPNHIRRLHFNTPVQVFFHHDIENNECIDVGFAYGTDVICACCGGVVPLDEIDYLEYNPEVWCNLEIELECDLREELNFFADTCGVMKDDED